MKRADLDLYTDYLLSTFDAATATGLSAMLEGEVSHDRITRFLSGQDFTSKDLWQQVKSMVRSVENSDGVLIFDDTIQEKAWTDENELMCWHYDHVSGRNVRGINLLNVLYHCNGASIPVAFELVKKPIQYCDIETRQLKRKSVVTKNELIREMIDTCIRNELKFRFVLMDSWFSVTENFEFITGKGRYFIAALKDNRLEHCKYPPAEPVALRLLAPRRGLTATVRSKSKNKSKSPIILLPTRPSTRADLKADSRKCQTATATPAEPGDLLTL
jgi:hypothetical protein